MIYMSGDSFCYFITGEDIEPRDPGDFEEADDAEGGAWDNEEYGGGDDEWN